jgi:hypothetical protein
MAHCECGCGVKSSGDFLPGHDQKLRASLERRVGGLLALRSLVESAESYVIGKIDDQDFTRSVEALFAKTVR